MSCRRMEAGWPTCSLPLGRDRRGFLVASRGISWLHESATPNPRVRRGSETKVPNFLILFCQRDAGDDPATRPLSGWVYEYISEGIHFCASVIAKIVFRRPHLQESSMCQCRSLKRKRRVAVLREWCAKIRQCPSSVIMAWIVDGGGRPGLSNTVLVCGWWRR